MSVRRKGVTGASEMVEGVIEREAVAAGSKSEHAALGVVEDGGGFVVVHVAGDTPFAEETLTVLEGQRVRASGVWSNGKLRVAREDLAVVAGDAADAAKAAPEAPEGDAS